MKKLEITKGLLVLSVVLLCVMPGMSYAKELPNSPPPDNGVTLQTGEPLNADEVNHLKLLIRIYKENGMMKEADMVERMLSGQLNDSELQLMSGSKIMGARGFIASDDHFVSSTHHLWTTVIRNWWMFGKNEHLGWSASTATGGDWPIPSIHMKATGWDSSGRLVYYSSFGFAPGSTVYCRNDGPSSGRARSEVYYKYGAGPYDYYIGVADGTY